MDRSLAYYPENAYAGYVKAWILFARDRDFNRTRDLLIHEFNKDTTRLDIMQDIGKLHYLMRDYEGAYRYYKKFMEIREARQLDIYKHENLRIAILLSKLGFKQKSEEYVKSFKAYSDNDKSIYKNLALAEYYCYLGDPQKALEHMRLFTKEDNYQYWILLFDMETGIDPIKSNPELKKIMSDIETRFWNTHKKIKVSLEEKGLLQEYQPPI
jgi:tetratricopeptide (TPR) repeat protein